MIRKEPGKISTKGIAYLDYVATQIESKRVLFFVVFANMYLLVTALQAQRRLWYDELFTFYMCQLPSMSTVWSALKAGVDLNPPLLYVLTRACQALFGNTELVTRLPAILGFLVMCLCICRFVSRNGSLLAGMAAMCVPLVSGAYYYSSEARAYGIELAFASIAAVCWQSAARDERRKITLPGLAVALAGALLSHCYALMILIPFVLAEGARFVTRRKPDWPMLLSLAAPCAAVVSYLPLLAASRQVSMDNSILRPEWGSIANSYSMIFQPAHWLIVAALVPIVAMRVSKESNPEVLQPVHEVVLALGFVLTPVFAVVLAMTVAKVFQDRYGLAAIIGASILIGHLAAKRASRIVTAGILLLFMGAFVMNSVLWATDIALSKRSSRSGFKQLLVLSDLDRQLPIVITDPILFLEFDHYESGDITNRLYFLTDPREEVRYIGTDLFSDAFYKLRKWFPIRSHVEDYEQFISTHERFSVLSLYDYPLDWALRKMVDDCVPLTFRGQFVLQRANAILAEGWRPTAGAATGRTCVPAFTNHSSK
ncbi:MAG TPA: glycosyltransferase family 39 protein [Bryobacteraceae bacterium]|jgi:hypothetical protein|nr:glycosyltransferase family 39 protein [Bryobacteraceae bacterium]